MAINRTDYHFIYHKRGGHDITFEISDQDESGDPSYYGYLSVDGSWIIQEVNTALGTYRYAMGISGYKTAGTGAWATRAALTYYYFNEVEPL